MTFPLTISISAALLSDFANCEYGAHEDACVAREEKSEACDSDETEVTFTRSGFTAYEILSRHRARIEIRDASEADLIYYAACSGTFALRNDFEPRESARRYRAANRIADILRPHAMPETVARWRMSDGY